MASKYKTTPFFRFLLAMIIIIPLAYFGASYYKGEDPIKNIKNKVENTGSSTRTTATSASQEDLINEQNKLIKQLEAQIKQKDREIAKLKAGQ